MSRQIKVLIVDDSTVIRRLLSDSIGQDPAIEVVGVAANGKIALSKIPQLNPDVITLDIEMPEMDGLQTLVELRKLYPKLPVIMFSTLTQRGAEATLDALSRGASDYVTKPANVGSVTAAMENVRNELVPKIKGLCSWYNAEKSPATSKLLSPIAPSASQTKPSFLNLSNAKSTRIDAVVIGVSTGGPNALQTLIPALPASLPVPVFIVQHMPPIFTKHLADRLNQLSQLEVTEAQNGDIAGPGGVWIAPGDFHMTLARDGVAIRASLNQGIPENSCRPAVDVLFRSASEIYGPNVLAVVLTGMGQDGMRGCQTIKSSGGRTIAQDEKTSVVWGMPAAVTQAGLADQVLPLSQIAAEIVSHCTTGRTARRELAQAT